LTASNQGIPAIHLDSTDVSEAYKDVIGRFMGEELPLRFTEHVKPGLLKRIFGGK
jgi:septum site-determining protein MinD